MNRFLLATPLLILVIAALVLPRSAQGFDDAIKQIGTPAGSPIAGAMSGTGAAYMLIANAGGESDYLIGGQTDVADVVEIHEIVNTSGVMEMRPLSDGLEIPAGGEAILEPGGYHVMLIGLTTSLSADSSFELTLEFAEAGEVTVPVLVQAAAPTGDEGEPITSGDLTISGVWARPAPMLSLGGATPAASPTS